MRGAPRTRLLCGGALLLFASALTTSAQEPTLPTETLHVSTRLVLVDVSVETRSGGTPVKGLEGRDFVLTEDNLPQKIELVSQDTLPLSVLFMFDLTDTVHPVLQHLAGDATSILRRLRPGDEVAVMTFSSHTHLEQTFTRDRMAAREALDAASASFDPKEPTFLFEDLWQAAQQSSRSQMSAARRVQVWVTDGSANDQTADRGLARRASASLRTEAEATQALQRSGAVVSALVERSTLPGSGHFGDIQRVAEQTGGSVVYATAGDADQRLRTLLDNLRARYTLAYKPGQEKPEGTLCRLRVQLSPAFWAAHPEWRPRDLVLRSRESYLRQTDKP